MTDTETPTRRQLSKARTAKRVLDEARTLFEAPGGYEGATIRAIATAAGSSTGAVNANYEGKAELYKAVYGHYPITPEQGRRLLAAQTSATERPNGDEKNTPELLMEVAKRLLQHGENPNSDFILSLEARAAAGAACIVEILA